MSKQIRMKFYESLPDEGLLALATHRLEELPEHWRNSAQCSVIVRRHKAEGARAVHHVQVDIDGGPDSERVYATCSDADPYAALSRAFESARASITERNVSPTDSVVVVTDSAASAASAAESAVGAAGSAS